MKIAICDDEQKYIDDIKKNLIEFASLNGMEFEIFEFTSPKKLVECDENFSIAFLDIEMPEQSGIDTGRKLREKNKNIILICVTAYNNYLDDALDIGITRFFEKPINSERFMRGLERAVSLVDETPITFELKDEDKNVFAVKCKDIIFVEITGRKTTVHTKEQDYQSTDSIKTWAQKLNKSYFVSPHKSFIINANYLTYYCNEYIMLDNKYKIPIAYRRRMEFKRAILKFMEK